VAGLDPGGLGVHPSHFVGLGLERDRIWHAANVFITEVLDERGPGSLIFDNYLVDAELSVRRRVMTLVNSVQ